MIQSFIDGIKKMIGKLTSAVSNVASTIAKYLHFSEPDLGPLSDFSESGGDMIDSFIKSMEKEQPALVRAVNDTAALIGQGWTNPTNNGVTSTDYRGGVSRIEQAIASSLGNGSGQMVIPIYIGTEHIDTIVVDALDRYNYATGGH